jgi:RNA polymerase sigma-70 factor (ECF subfamily)
VREYKIDIAGSESEIHEDVVSRSQCRDLAAFEQLVRKYQPYAFSLAMKFLCDEAEASDVVQDSFLRVWKNIDRYDPNQKFSTWLYKIVANLCVDRFRALKRTRSLFLSRERDPMMEDLPDERNWETLRSHEELADIIRTLSNRLSRTQKLVFTLRDLQDLTVGEVVEITDLSIGSVKTNLHYARKSIRDALVRHFGVVRSDL